MKIGLVTTEFLPVWGGIASYCLNLCKGLSQKVEFHVITSYSSDKSMVELDRQGNIKVQIHSITSRGNVGIGTLGYQMNLVRHLPRLINENNLDLVHASGPLADQLLRIKGINIPYVLTYHSTFAGQRQGISISGNRFRDLHSSEKITLLFYPFLRLLESISLKRTRNIIAVSKSVRDELVDNYHYKGKITVIPNSIDTDMFQPAGVESNTKRVLFSGRLISMKGPQYVIKAIPQVLKRHPDVVFSFAGAGDHRTYLRMLEEEEIPSRQVTFQYVNYQDMPQFYNSGCILVLPSLIEGFPMTILEGMACGLPVVASNVGGVADLVHDGVTGFLIEKGDYNALAEHINLLLDDEALLKKMSSNALKLVTENYSADRMAERTLEVYRQVLEGSE